MATSAFVMPIVPVIVAAVLPTLLAGLLLAGSRPSPDGPSGGEIAYVQARYECLPGTCER